LGACLLTGRPLPYDSFESRREAGRSPNDPEREKKSTASREGVWGS